MFPKSASGTMVDLYRIRPPQWKGATTYLHVKRALPFVESFRGQYTHRVRAIQVLVNSWGSHMAVRCWCGQTVSISQRKPNRGNALMVEPTGRPICATCEGRAIGAGQLGAPEIAGRPVMFSPRTERQSA